MRQQTVNWQASTFHKLRCDAENKGEARGAADSVEKKMRGGENEQDMFSCIKVTCSTLSASFFLYSMIEYVEQAKRVSVLCPWSLMVEQLQSPFPCIFLTLD